MTEISVASVIDNLAGFALASVGLVFTAAALLKVTWIACHNVFHAAGRYWALRRPVGAETLPASLKS